MTNPKYTHVVEYDADQSRIIVYRLMSTGKKMPYTEIQIGKIESAKRNLEGIGRILGEALILDMVQLRDSIV